MPNYPQHLVTFDYVGVHSYFLTFCCHDRVRHFLSADAVAVVLQQFLRTARRERFAVSAYCFMPDHVHLVLDGRATGSDLKAFVADAKRFSAWEFRKQFAARLWQRYGYEHVLRDEEATARVIRYIIENPVRAGLVSTPIEYAYWGSGLCTREELIEVASEVEAWTPKGRPGPT